MVTENMRPIRTPISSPSAANHIGLPFLHEAPGDSQCIPGVDRKADERLACLVGEADLVVDPDDAAREIQEHASAVTGQDVQIRAQNRRDTGQGSLEDTNPGRWRRGEERTVTDCGDRLADREVAPAGK